MKGNGGARTRSAVSFLFPLRVAGAGIEPAPQGYEPCEVTTPPSRDITFMSYFLSRDNRLITLRLFAL